MRYLKINQPKEDFYSWIKDNILKDIDTREQVKKKFISWLYGGVNNKILDGCFDRNILYDYYDGCNIVNAFGKTIVCNNVKAVNYLISSSAAYMFYEQAFKIHKALENKKTKIRFLIHDDIVLDVCKSDKNLISDLIEIFKDTKFGIFPVQIKIGKNFADMRKVLCYNKT